MFKQPLTRAETGIMLGYPSRYTFANTPKAAIHKTDDNTFANTPKAAIHKTDRKFNRMRPSMARVLGLETRSAKAG